MQQLGQRVGARDGLPDRIVVGRRARQALRGELGDVGRQRAGHRRRAARPHRRDPELLDGEVDVVDGEVGDVDLGVRGQALRQAFDECQVRGPKAAGEAAPDPPGLPAQQRLIDPEQLARVRQRTLELRQIQLHGPRLPACRRSRRLAAVAGDGTVAPGRLAPGVCLRL
jgi:hypothetical protein